MHELVAFQAFGLMKIKMGLKNIEDQNLKEIYKHLIVKSGGYSNAFLPQL